VATDKRRPADEPMRRRWLSAVLLLLVLALGAQLMHRYLSQPGRLPLRVVEVTGQFNHLVRSEIERRVAKNIDGGFFTVDMARVRQAVLAMPWVAEVGVRRVWPDTLRMQVTEQMPLARWGDDALVNLHGEVFAPQPMPNVDALPQLQGDTRNAPAMVAFYLKLHALLVGSDLRIARLQQNPRSEFRVYFDNGLELVLGRERLVRRFEEFLKVYPQLAAYSEQAPKRIDMRYQHGFAVRWQQQTADVAMNHKAGGDS
jgi:cell division protein FtsQ